MASEFIPDPHRAAFAPRALPKPANEPAAAGQVALDADHLHSNGIFGFDELDIRGRSFTFLRSLLHNDFYRPGGRVLAICSARPGDGKTFVATNLAAAISRIQPACLVDLDLRKPMLAERFGLVPQAGVDDLLEQAQSFDDVAVTVAGEALTLFPIRQARRNSTELLSGPMLAQMFAALRDQPDHPFILVDTPPALVLDDMLLIAEHVDGVIFVVEEGKSRSDELKEAIRLLHGTPLIGTVLNRSLSSSGDRYSYAGYYETRDR
ncbi:CpsD/CapB family tyrosine-protein kinase [Sphingomonas sp. C3-2]|uniref:tyrosine-protein kinase family protein n=1 Tax=Sphingomonas sp. C3-2 TaxID=3062169 RepID=UPI00294B005D|nr:CpsD/CapB family tyrosine-protein kinase [Sphingomonas sp. C3-2]WOK36589.1 CpsD/CapB family tyrosine-protein kinase [Sphingomonas sp. C3-2]